MGSEEKHKQWRHSLIQGIAEMAKGAKVNPIDVRVMDEDLNGPKDKYFEMFDKEEWPYKPQA